ncbi:MAG: glycosyltransferase [Nitrososphaerota archaeon]
MVKVSIGIPSYNEGVALLQILERLRHQRLSPDVQIEEIIISDDSEDGTPELVIKYLSEHHRPHVHLYHHEERRGVAEAWNEVLRRSEGEVVVLFDADVVLSPTTVDRLVMPFREDESLGLVTPSILPLRPRSYFGGASYFIGLALQGLRLTFTVHQLTLQGRGLALSKRLAKSIDLPSQIIAVDLFVLCRALELGYKVKVAKDAFIFFRPAESLHDFSSQTLRAMVGHRQLELYVRKVLPKRLTLLNQLKGSVKWARRYKREVSALLLAFLLFPFYIPKVWRGATTHIWEPASTSKPTGT